MRSARACSVGTNAAWLDTVTVNDSPELAGCGESSVIRWVF
jgi:hypothetical protein